MILHTNVPTLFVITLIRSLIVVKQLGTPFVFPKADALAAAAYPIPSTFDTKWVTIIAMMVTTEGVYAVTTATNSVRDMTLRRIVFLC